MISNERPQNETLSEVIKKATEMALTLGVQIPEGQRITDICIITILDNFQRIEQMSDAQIKEVNIFLNFIFKEIDSRLGKDVGKSTISQIIQRILEIENEMMQELDLEQADYNTYPVIYRTKALRSLATAFKRISQNSDNPKSKLLYGLARIQENYYDNQDILIERGITARGY